MKKNTEILNEVKLIYKNLQTKDNQALETKIKLSSQFNHTVKKLKSNLEKNSNVYYIVDDDFNLEQSFIEKT